ncbi:MAG: segregation/condensation protein A [Deltaproteobacteria bacterium]|nr:segregation/condensation protein A [Deltaproteobacteria bacterium]
MAEVLMTAGTEEQFESEFDYDLELPLFEGPLDLLLHLVQKSRVNIFDIRISLITEQYLEYIELMKELNIDMAGEFLAMAAELARIKSKMLIPVEDTGEEAEAEPPWAELQRRLIEYQRFKEAAIELGKRDILGRDTFTRELPVEEKLPPGEETIEPVEFMGLLRAFKKVLERLPEANLKEVAREEITIRARVMQLIDGLRSGGRRQFTSLFAGDRNRQQVVITFLAILELARLRMVRIEQGAGEDEFWIDPRETLDAEHAQAALGNTEEEGGGYRG